MNIVSMAAQYLTPMIIDKIASSLGITSPLAQKAIAAILPTILGSLMGSSQKPDGLKNLTDILGKQDTSMLGKLGDLIGGPTQGNMINAGTNVLGSLLGNSALGSLTGALGKFAGIGEAPTKGLLGLVGPVALGALAKQQKDSGLDGAGLAKMLLGQKDNISAAMPAGFADLLKGTGLLDSLAPAAAPRPVQQAAPAQPAAARPAQPTPAAASPAPAAPSYTAEPPRASGGGSWLPWAAALGALLFGGWYFLSGARGPSLPAAPAITFNNQNVGAQVGSVVEGLRGTLGSIKDEATAKSALPRLQETLKQLDGINTMRGNMPAEAKKGLAAYIAQLLPIIRPMIDNALKTAGVGPVAKPVLDNILNRLDTMSKG
ncbi:MAG: DUF937 domain-containing protein [Hyphomicrobiaceae bacterium]